MRPKARELRVMPIAASLAAQYRPRQQGFTPQRDQALRIEVARMKGPQTHVVGNVSALKLYGSGITAPRPAASK